MQEADYCVASNLRMDMFVFFVHFFKSHFYLGGLWRAQFKKWLSFFFSGGGGRGGGGYFLRRRSGGAPSASSNLYTISEQYL